jgi:hypothetical protein
MYSMQEEYERQIVIPVVYKGLPPDMALIGRAPATVTAHVRDRGGVLLQYNLRRLPVIIDMNERSDTARSFVLSDTNVEALLMKYLAPTTALLNFSPRSIEMAFDRRVRKSLPVVFGGEIRTAPGYIVSGDISFEPPEVTVFAAASVMETLDSISTEYVEISNADKPLVRRLRLNPPGGATTEPDAVSADIPVEAFAEKTIETPVVASDVPAGYKMRMFPASIRIVCRAPLSKLRELTADHFLVEASLDDFEAASPRTLPLRLSFKPIWVEQAVLSQDSVEFIIEQTG